ncbi:MAG: hypothetical protein JNK82_16805 [Myxococcaceae bacterium]|nr:hypothetical protein [Myxococcaceae bacterium]
MISALVVALTLSSEPTPPPTPPPMSHAEGELIPTSFAMYIALLEPMVIATGSSVSVAPLSATVRLGAVLDGRHALLAGISFAGSFASSSDGVTISFMPTYRYFFKPLRAGGFSPYVQGELFVGYGATEGGASVLPFGFGGSFGGELLFSRNFGITAGAGARFIHSESTGGGGGGRVTGNQLGIYASAGLSLHF